MNTTGKYQNLTNNNFFAKKAAISCLFHEKELNLQSFNYK